MFGFKLFFLFKFFFYFSFYNMYRYIDINVEDLLFYVFVFLVEILLRFSKGVKCFYENVSCIYVIMLLFICNSG